MRPSLHSLLSLSLAQCLAPLGFGEGENSSWELGACDPWLLISDPRRSLAASRIPGDGAGLEGRWRSPLWSGLGFMVMEVALSGDSL